MEKLVLTQLTWKDRNPLVFSLFDENQKLKTLWAFGSEGESLLNRIYIGRVETVSANIHAAFVRIQPDMIAYLPLEDAKCPVYTRKQSKSPELRPGDELLVQVTKDAVKTKQPVLSARLSVHGTYCVLTTGSKESGVSKKIPKDRAEVLRTLLHGILPKLPENTGILLRTSAETISDEILKADIMETVSRFRTMLERSRYLTVCTLVEGEIPGYVDRMKSLNLDNLEVITDREEVYAGVKKSFPSLAQAGHLTLYKDSKIALSAVYSIRARMEELTRRQVWLRSGSNIIIEQLETLTFIDVNSAKNGKGNAFSVNKEAASEIARQIRLRNLSGMILIDFINMKEGEENHALIQFLKSEIASDPVKCKYIDMTGLGLVELTRQKKEKSLKELLEISG